MESQFQKINHFGFIRVAAASPITHVADPAANGDEIFRSLQAAQSIGAQIVVFPELCISGYTCQDLFLQETLLNACLDTLRRLVVQTKRIPVLYVVGMPLLIKNRLYNCAVVVNQGEIIGIIPKEYLPNSGEFYEKRWFVSGANIQTDSFLLDGRQIPFGKLLFRVAEGGPVIGVEICEDLWSVIPPSNRMVLEGADVILNCSASNELVSKAEYRRTLVCHQSARCLCAYAYASCGVFESTTDLVFSGDLIIAENGTVLAQADRYLRRAGLIAADIDLKRLSHERMVHVNFKESLNETREQRKYFYVETGPFSEHPDFDKELLRAISKTPFIPQDPGRRDEHCREIINIQAAGLTKRMEHAGITKTVLGVSGGLDSTLALLVCHHTMQLLGLPAENIIAVSMPGFGTSADTRQNALALAAALGVTMKIIDIRESCERHMREIGHDPQQWDVTYENIQARERTKILFNLANHHQALVVGTGDLSELALGWCTYGGDHMSMYAVNSSVPKTLIIDLIRYAASSLFKDNTSLSATLHSILDTPISPELLPPDESGRISQKTEDLIGPYILHDFFLYCFLRKGDSPEKILFLARKAFEEQFTEEEIHAALRIFFKRFFMSQFKRSCMPDGPKVGSVALSPRGDWKMPSDACVSAWLDSL